MKITDVLRKYRVLKSEVEAVDSRIKAYRELLKTPDLNECGYIYYDTPIGTGGQRIPSSPVEREVIQKIEGHRLNSELIMAWIQDDESRTYMKRIEVKQIEIALEGLGIYERSIVEWKYMDHMNWNAIEISFNNTYKQRNDLTEGRIRQINDIAINKLTVVLKPFYNRYMIREGC